MRGKRKINLLPTHLHIKLVCHDREKAKIFVFECNIRKTYKIRVCLHAISIENLLQNIQLGLILVYHSNKPNS